MSAWLVAVWDSIRSGIWFVPTVALILAVTAAIALPRIDQAVSVSDVRGLSWMETTAEGARSTLASITGALIAMASVAFSVSMVTLSLTTSQFGSRLLRTFLNSNATQVTLGVFLGASVYCLLVLQSIVTEEDQTFVPHLSIGLAVTSTVAAIGVFVFFMHHVAQSIQAQTVVRSVAADLDRAIEVLFPEKIGDAIEPNNENDQEKTDSVDDHAIAVCSEDEGYLQAVDGGRLLDLAHDRDIVIELAYQPGDFVVGETPLVRVISAARCDEELCEEIRSAFVTGSRRTPRQDIKCAIEELVEVAVRALSPGVNDPFTAVACIDYLGAALRRLASRKTPQPLRYDGEGKLRVIARPVTFEDALESAFGQIREYGRGSAVVLLRLLRALEIVAAEVNSSTAANAVKQHSEMVLSSARRNLQEDADMKRIENFQAKVVQAVESATDRPKSPRQQR